MTLTLQIEAVYTRALLLRQQATASPVQPDLLEAALQELTFVLEELQTSEEELYQQNQTLIATRQDLENERQRYQDLFDFAPNGYLVTDKTGIIQEANAAITALLGFSSDYWIGKPLAILFPETIQPTFYTLLAQLNQPYRSNQEPRESWEIQISPRQGKPLDVAITVSTTYDAEGNVLRLLWLLNDITQQKQTNQWLLELNSNLEAQVLERTQELRVALAQADALNQMKSDFLATISHELRTPLNSILGLSQSLLEFVYGEINDRQSKAISTIETSGIHLLGLIDNILDLTTSEASHITLNLVPVHVAQLCAFSFSYMQIQAQRKQIELSADIPIYIGTVLADERRLLQILLNLLNNAIKFTPGPGQVSLQVQTHPAEPPASEPPHPPPTWISFKVCDTGIGIAPENLKKLFQPFIQLDSRLNRQYDGIGLGLVLVKRFTELHGGHVAVDSIVGRGSCFTVHIPYQPAS